MRATVAMWIYPPPKAWQEPDLLEWRCIGLLAGASQQERQWKLPQLGFSQWEHQVCIYIYLYMQDLRQQAGKMISDLKE